MKLPITKPLFDEEDYQAVQAPLKSGWVVQGPHVERFEALFSEFTASRHAIAVSSCTAGLHISAAALGVRPGDEVIVPAFTWVSTAYVIEHLGGRPVFVDIDLRTFNIDPDAVSAAISPRTVGIIPVHLFGLPANMSELRAIADRHDLWLLEDAACGFASRYDGVHVGTMGQAGAFSFHPRKAITTGEGGMITTGNDEFASLARSLRDHGASRSDLERHQQTSSFLLADYDNLGFNYRMTDLQGALGVSQMGKANLIQNSRRQVARWYDEALADLSWLELPVRDERLDHAYQAYVCLFQPTETALAGIDERHALRNEVMEQLEKRGVATRPGTHAPPFLGVFKERLGHVPSDFPRAYAAEKQSLALPLFAEMTEAEVDYVAHAMREAASDVGL